MNWLLFTFLACSSEKNEKPQNENKKLELELHSARSAPSKETEEWANYQPVIRARDVNDQTLSSLSAQLNIPIMAWGEKRTDPEKKELSLLYFTQLEKLPESRDTAVLILDGDWSKEELAKLAWQGKPMIQISQTMALFASEKHLKDPQLKAGVIAWQLEEYYGFPRQRLDRDIPIALYGILATEEADANHEHPHMRYFSAHSSADSSMVVRLATARTTKEQRALEVLAKDIDPWVRARAMDRLQSIDILDVGLSDPSSLVRVVAGHQLSILAKEGHKDACSPLRKASQAADAYVRWKGAYGLGFCDAIDELVVLLDDVDIDVQRQAAQSLGKQKDVFKAEKPLKRKIRTTNSFVRRWALQSLAQIQSKEIEEFLQNYLHQSTSILERNIIAQELHRRGHHITVERFIPPKPPKDHKDLERILAAKDPTALKDIAKFLALKKRFHEQLFLLAEHEDSEIRKSAVEGLGWNGDPRVYQFLDDSDPDVVVTALDGIRRSRIGNGKGIEPLLRHPDSEIRYRALQALVAVFGELSQNQRALIGEFCADSDERIRAAALMMYPKKMKSDEPSDWVRWKISLSDSIVFQKGVDDMASLSILGDADQKAWIRGIVEFEDEFLHRRFSWNDEEDRPPSHRVLRPPLFREYGFPNRG